MLVYRVFEYDKSVNAIERALLAQGAKEISVFTVDSTPYKPDDKVQGVINRLFILHHTNYPQSTFVLGCCYFIIYLLVICYFIAPNEKHIYPRAVCDRGFDLILAKLSSGLVQDTAGKFTVSGKEFQLVDFFIRFGPATMGVTTKGVVVEVDYGPSCIATQCSNMLAEFIESFFPEQAQKKPSVLQKVQPEPYVALDTMTQYLEVFNTLRKKP
uniref:Mediator of RNA polymerase II transcription subunit 20 n=1 Tax=Syphacia muris TaxID=451379 RepID=A0A0N5ADT9_9BILA